MDLSELIISLREYSSLLDLVLDLTCGEDDISNE